MDGVAPDRSEARRQVGAIGGLGTVLYPTALDFKGSSNDAPGRIEFETVEALTVKLGSAGDTFTVGGDALEQQLPQSRQEKVLEFDQSPTIMTTVIGGAGADTLRVVSTVDVARSALNSTEGVVSINNVHSDGQFQHLSISGRGDYNGYFTLQYQYQETSALPLDIFNQGVAGETALRDAVRAAFLILGDPTNIDVTANGDGYDITFAALLGHVPTLVAQIVPLMLVGSGGTDRLRIQSTYEDIFFNGGDATDSAAVNVDAVSQQAFTPYDVVAHLSVTGTNGNNDQLIQRVDVTGGTFKLGYTPLSGPHAGELEITSAIAWDAPATAVRDALAALPGIGKDSKDEPNVQVDFAPGGYEVHFINDLANTAQNVFTTQVVVTTTTPGGASNEVQHVHLEHVTSGTSASTTPTR